MRDVLTQELVRASFRDGGCLDARVVAKQKPVFSWGNWSCEHMAGELKLGTQILVCVKLFE